jgi:hypothetical protein
MPYADPERQKQYFRDRYLRYKRSLESRGKIFRAKRPKAKSRKEWESRKRITALASMKRRREKVRQYETVRYKQNPQVKLAKCARAAIRRALQRMALGAKKVDSSLGVLGCTIEQLQAHIQSQFQVGMAWNNYGYRGWHVDHIRPLSSFNLFDPEEQKIAFSYRNLQPLWAADNMRKGRKVVAG